ncbi:hypothetical protein NC653_023963 [Populus alba x Populus x berolinensis]|uniref:Uncharacterized protein n=1 Tax=Populus alba x Populus x berolinensis TaxID=444605 RepID=A0AAD6QCV8_9ROSI|nr:hypothetical protein NC653_023963 [Populus alba x Populus x berolinensis]
MSSIVQSFRKRNSSAALPVSQTHFSKDQAVAGLRRRLSSLSLKFQPISSPATQWAFQRSKSVSAMGEYAGSSVKKWWDWGWSWILSRKPVFAQDLEMNEEETRVLGCHSKGSWGHVFYKFRSEVDLIPSVPPRFLMRSSTFGGVQRKLIKPWIICSIRSELNNSRFRSRNRILFCMFLFFLSCQCLCMRVTGGCK